MQSFVRAKLHGIRVTGADLNHHGSINRVIDRVAYDVFRDEAGRLDMRILEAATGAGEPPQVATHIRVA